MNSRLRSCLFLTLIIFAADFYQSVQAQSIVRFLKPEWLRCSVSDPVEMRIFYEYGAVYMSKVFWQRGAKRPKTCRFGNEDEVAKFADFRTPANRFSFGNFYLQPEAKASLEAVFNRLGGYMKVVRNCNGTTTCSNGVNDDWGWRTYAQTVANWKTPLSTPVESIVLRVPASGGQKDKPKMYGAAVPGSSQHHLGLAIDVNQAGSGPNACLTKCEEALRENYWFRTVRYDPYHFTYLGYPETELPQLGLIKVKCKDGKGYWVPNIPSVEYGGYKFWECEISPMSR